MMTMLMNDAKNGATARRSGTKTTGFLLFAVYIAIAVWAAFLVLTSDPVLTMEGLPLVEGGRVVRTWSWENVSGLLTGLATLPGFGTVMFGIKAGQSAYEEKNGGSGG